MALRSCIQWNCTMTINTFNPSAAVVAAAAVNAVPAAFDAASAFVASLDQHPFGALVLTILLVAVVVAVVKWSARP